MAGTLPVGLAPLSTWCGDMDASDFPTREVCIAMAGEVPPYAAMEARKAADMVVGTDFNPAHYPFACALCSRAGTISVSVAMGSTLVSASNQIVFVRFVDGVLVPDAVKGRFGSISGTVSIAGRDPSSVYLLVACPCPDPDSPQLGTFGIRAPIGDDGTVQIPFVPAGSYVLGVVRVGNDEVSWDTFGYARRVTVKFNQTTSVTLP